MVDTIIYRIRRPDGSYVDEPIDLPPSVATAISSLMRMHGGTTAAPVDADFAVHVANGPPRPSKAVVPAPEATVTVSRRLRIAAATTGIGVAVLCGVLLARVVRPTAQQAY